MIQLIYAVMTGALLMTGAKEFDSIEECEYFAQAMRQINDVAHAGFVCMDLSK